MRILQFNKGHNVVYGDHEPIVGHRMEVTVLNDGLGRFVEGDPIITSPVKSITGNAENGCLTVKTNNTTYAFIPKDLYVGGTTTVELRLRSELFTKWLKLFDEPRSGN